MKINGTIKRPSVWIAAGFGVFLVWVIRRANAGADAVFFDLARAVPMGDKLGHFLLFGLLAWAMNLALAGRSFLLWRRPAVRMYFGTAGVLVLVTVEELSQAWFPSRTCDVRDWVADVLGIAFFTWVSARTLGARLKPQPVV